MNWFDFGGQRLKGQGNLTLLWFKLNILGIRPISGFLLMPLQVSMYWTEQKQRVSLCAPGERSAVT